MNTVFSADDLPCPVSTPLPETKHRKLRKSEHFCQNCLVLYLAHLTREQSKAGPAAECACLRCAVIRALCARAGKPKPGARRHAREPWNASQRPQSAAASKPKPPARRERKAPPSAKTSDLVTSIDAVRAARLTPLQQQRRAAAQRTVEQHAEELKRKLLSGLAPIGRAR